MQHDNREQQNSIPPHIPSPPSGDFFARVDHAIADANLQKSLERVKDGFINKRAKARAALPEFELLRNQARDIKNHTLENLDQYLDYFANQVTASGGHVHWAKNAEEARAIILNIADKRKVKLVTKGKSMVSEEIAINEAFADAGIQVVETDLGEYIIQLRGEKPSHIIAPAVHVIRSEIEKTFKQSHLHLPKDRHFAEAADLVREARLILRDQYFKADMGITGANLLVAETGSSVIVTNEGNGDLTQMLGKCHVVVAGIEKLVPSLEDANTILRVLARSATGQAFSSYVTYSTGPKRTEDLDGPDEFHVVLLDNGRSNLMGTDDMEVLRCIRCGACMNHCPIYSSIGGHAYGSVYPGPIGSVLTPHLPNTGDGYHLPNASTFCGRCESVCPVHIPLPKLLRNHRRTQFKNKQISLIQKLGLAVWGFLAWNPKIYRITQAVARIFLRILANQSQIIRRVPLGKGWTDSRDLPAPARRSFLSEYAARNKDKS